MRILYSRRTHAEWSCIGTGMRFPIHRGLMRISNFTTIY